MMNIEGVVMEKEGEIGIDEIKDLKKREIKGKRIVIVVYGGNLDLERMKDVREREISFEGMKKYLILRFNK